MVPSVPEIGALIARMLLPRRFATPFVLAWSYWRRHHQARAAEAHYRTRGHLQTQL
jgi:hypothetical protein